MPRRKKLDIAPVMEAFLAEIDFRISRSMTEAVRDIERRIDRLEKRLAGRAGRAASPRRSKVCRKASCNGRVVAHGLCSRHYQQWRYHKKKTEELQAAKAKAAKTSSGSKESQPKKRSPRKRAAKAT